MRQFQVEYNDPQSASQRFTTSKSWDREICFEIKGMLETMGCTDCQVVPVRPLQSERLPSRLTMNPLGSRAFEPSSAVA